MAATVEGEGLRELLSAYPAGVCVVTVAAGGNELGLTLSSLVSLSLDPPLVGLAVSREAAMHELLREAGCCAVSLLATGQEGLAQRFSRGMPPIAMWHGVETMAGATGAPLLVGALGWVECKIREEVSAGTHTFFVCVIERVEVGIDAPALVRVRGGYSSA
ncbi:MAG: flavin reductase [Actinobacteria bacterium]|nr:flavin reductase [Actinomycetota bacterium]